MAGMDSVSSAVAKLYDTYPFPPEPLLDVPPPGYNWRWNWQAAYGFCTGRLPQQQEARILDAGCGTGVSTEYLVHLNPEATVTGLDISQGAIAVAQERCQRSGADRVTFHHLSLYDVDQLPGEFDLINSVGVLHHLADPHRGIQALASKLAPGGIFHIFVYAALGRWEISLMQQAIGLLQGQHRGNYKDGVALGRQIFASLPDQNRLKRREQERWSLENQKDECFADMYVHPQEIVYTIDSLFELIDASGLEFVGFSNPDHWQLERLLGESPEALARAEALSERDRYRLIELLDPDVSHFEFFLARPPLPHHTWENDEDLLAATVVRHPCMDGWPSRCVFNADYQVVNLSEADQAFLAGCDNPAPDNTVAALIASSGLTLAEVRSHLKQRLILLSPATESAA